MPWIRIEIGASGRLGEAIGEKLSALGAAAVTYLDDGDSPLLEPDPWAISDPGAWSAVRVAGLFELDADLRAVRLAFPDRRVDIAFLPDDDWVNAWRQFAIVRRFGRLTIIPSEPDGAAASDAPVPDPGSRSAMPAEQIAAVMHLDPGLAFGSGSHPTTRLCLEWLAEWLAERLAARDMRACSMLDYGCGSGVLSIAAKLLGAGRVVGVDHDPQALTATRANATRNGVGFAVEHSDGFSEGDDQSGGETETAKAPFDIVMANIVSGTLVELAPRLSGYVAPAGMLVLCGVLSDQVDEVVSAYPDFRFHVPTRLGEWVLLHGEHI